MHFYLKYLLLLLFAWVIIFLPSCSSIHYGIADTGNSPIYFTKPVSTDSIKSGNYVGGSFSHSIYSAYNENETNYFGKAYFFRSHAEKYFDFAYGAFGYVGNYKVDKINNYKGNKSLYGAGVSGEINANIPFGVFEWRIIGIKTTLLYEDGKYSQFRKSAEKESLIVNNNSNFVYNIGFSNEYIFKIKNKHIVGLYGCIGITKDLNMNSSIATQAITLHYTQKNITTFLHYSSFSNYEGFNLLSLFFQTSPMWGIGVSYRIP